MITDSTRTSRRHATPWWQRSPTLVMHVPLVGSLLAILISDSLVGVHWPLLVIGGVSAISYLMIWGVHLLVCAAGRQHANARRWLIAPVLVAVAVLLWAAHVPLRLRFELSRGSFNDVVAAIESGDLSICHDDFEPESGQVCDPPNRAGSFSVDRILDVPGALLFEDTTGLLFGTGGFAHLDERPTPEFSTPGLVDFEFHELGGGWYSFTATERSYTF